MTTELLTPVEMARVDAMAAASGPHDGIGLMRRAGAAVAAACLRRFPDATPVDVLCGPGNNGGDGYVAARILAEAGVDVRLWALGRPAPGSDAAIAAAECPLQAAPLGAFAPEPCALVVDALFGAGLTRPLEGDALRAVEAAGAAGCRVLAVDLPSGVSGESGSILGGACQATLTVTFVRQKPGHLLLPGRTLCGETVVADIGIGAEPVAAVGPRCHANLPALWRAAWPAHAADVHKYSRGHVGVFSGGVSSTGAARLAAIAAARIGAGAVTLLSPGHALAVNAAQLTSIILRKVDSMEDVREWLDRRRPEALVFGPGLGPAPKVGAFAIELIKTLSDDPPAIVIDADGLTSLALQSEAFLAAAGRAGGPKLLLTPHEGEFGRLFPDIARKQDASKVERARQAAARANATVVYKGADTVIAAQDGRAAINANGTPLLATAGSGDVLSGMIAGLVAQGMPSFEAACAAVWIHAEAARNFGPGLIAEDLPQAMRPVLRGLLASGSAGEEASR